MRQIYSIMMMLGLQFLINGSASAQYMRQFSFINTENNFIWEMRAGSDAHFAYRLIGLKRDIFVNYEQKYVSHKAAFKNEAVSLLYDWHPWADNFRVSGGMTVGFDKLQILSEPKSDYLVDDLYRLAWQSNLAQYQSWFGALASLPADFTKNIRQHASDTVEQIDLRVNSEIELSPVAGYIGFGWASRLYSSSAFYFSMDIGILYYPNIQLRTELDGNLSMLDAQQTEIVMHEYDKLQRQLKKQIDEYQYLPYASVNLSLPFG